MELGVGLDGEILQIGDSNGFQMDCLNGGQRMHAEQRVAVPKMLILGARK